MKRIDSFFKPTLKRVASDRGENSYNEFKDKGNKQGSASSDRFHDPIASSKEETVYKLPKITMVELETEIVNEKKSSSKSMSITAVLSANFPDIGEVSEYLFSERPENLPLTDQQRKTVLINVFVPEATFDFPKRCYGKRKLSFQRDWMTKWEWLAFSPTKGGAYCKYCVLFASEAAGKGLHQKLGSLVLKPFNNWKDATERFREHTSSKYHQFSKLRAENFLKIMTSEMEDVASQVSEQRRKEKEQNRAALRPIIESIIFCGEQELPMRGDNDSRPLSLEKPPHKDGKFRALLRCRSSYDETLRSHLINSPKNATYISPQIQNEIINICGNLTQKQIVDQVKHSKYFAILGDETLDVSGIEQFSMCVRYVHEGSLREDFLSFFEVYDLSGEVISEKILNKCKDLELNLDHLIGQGHDGAANMGGKISGVQARIKQQFPKANYVHCASHRLNLVLSRSLSIPDVRNAIGVVKEVCNLFNM